MRTKVRHLLWLLAVLLPVALYAVGVERNESSPRPILVTLLNGNQFGTSDVVMFSWSPDSKRIRVENKSDDVLVDAASGRISKRPKQQFSKQQIRELIAQDGCGLNAGDTCHTDSPDGKVSATVTVESRPYPGTDGDRGNFYYIILDVNLYDKKSKKLLHRLWTRREDDGQYSETIEQAKFVYGGKFFYALSLHNGSQTIHIWRVADGKKVLGTRNLFGRFATISSDGKIAASWMDNTIGGYDSNECCWVLDEKTNKRVKKLETLKECWVWDTATHKPIKKLQNPDEIAEVQFSPDGRTLAVGGKNGTLTLWRIR
jgi:WD40 repeat protein